MHFHLIFTATAVLLFTLVRSGDVITAIHNCTFPNGMEAAPPPHLQLKNFKKLNSPKVRPGNGGAKGRVYDNVVKWFVSERSNASPGFKWFQSPDIPKDSKQSIEHVCTCLNDNSQYSHSVMLTLPRRKAAHHAFLVNPDQSYCHRLCGYESTIFPLWSERDSINFRQAASNAVS